MKARSVSVSNYPGRNGSERGGSLVKVESHWPSLFNVGEGSILVPRPAKGYEGSGGVAAATRVERRAVNWGNPPRPWRKWQEQGRPHKSGRRSGPRGERVADEPGVVRMGGTTQPCRSEGALLVLTSFDTSEAGGHEKGFRQSAGAEAKDIHQREGRQAVAVLGDVLPCDEAGGPPRSLPVGESQPGSAWHRWQGFRGDRNPGARWISGGDTAGSSPPDVPTDAQPTGGDTERKR